MEKAFKYHGEQFDIEETPPEKYGKFAKFHYLKGDVHPRASCWLLKFNSCEIGFCAIYFLTGHAGVDIVQRLVIIPNFQHCGLGLVFLRNVAHQHQVSNRVLRITTSNPRFRQSLSNSQNWKRTRTYPRGCNPHGNINHLNRRDFPSLLTETFQYHE